jgi:hypothetical protein
VLAFTLPSLFSDSFNDDNIWEISFIVGLFLRFLWRHCCTKLSTTFASSAEYLCS